MEQHTENTTLTKEQEEKLKNTLTPHFLIEVFSILEDLSIAEARIKYQKLNPDEKIDLYLKVKKIYMERYMDK